MNAGSGTVEISAGILWHRSGLGRDGSTDKYDRLSGYLVIERYRPPWAWSVSALLLLDVGANED
jgi:hypothetical protein